MINFLKLGVPLSKRALSELTATRLGAAGGAVGGGITGAQEFRDDDGFDAGNVLGGIGSGILAGLGLRGAGVVGSGLVRGLPSGAGRVQRIARSPVGLGAVGAGAAFGPSLWGMKFGDGDKKPSKGSERGYEPQGAPIGGVGSDPFSMAAMQLQGASGSGVDGIGDIPDYFSYMNDPDIRKLVEMDIASMQSPLRRSIKTKKELRAEGEASTRAGMEEFRRVSKNLRKESRTAANEYQEGAANRRDEAEDAMTRVADRLLGSSVTSPETAAIRERESAEDIGRRLADTQREVEQSSGLMESSSDFMGDLAAVEEMESARDIRDANRQKERDIDEINAQIADIAAQAPALRQKYAAGLADYEMDKYKLQSDAAIQSQNALQKLLIEKAKADAKSGGSAGFSDWLGDYRKNERSTGSIESETEGGTMRESLYPTQRMTPEEVATLRQVYDQYGPDEAANYMSYINEQILEGLKK